MKPKAPAHRANIVLAAVAFALLSPAPLVAGESYYLLMFGSQRVPNQPNYAHTFAVFVRASWPGDGPCAGNPTLETHTISWLPCNLVVRTFALLPEKGANIDMHRTMRWAVATGQRVSLWGAYPITRDLYCRALRRINQLNSGSVRYKANDAGYNTNNVSNCIHGVAAVLTGGRVRVASPGWGETASYTVLRRMRDSILDDRPQWWVASALGLDAYPIIYRPEIANPHSTPVRGRIFRLFGGERDLMATYGPPQ